MITDIGFRLKERLPNSSWNSAVQISTFLPPATSHPNWITTRALLIGKRPVVKMTNFWVFGTNYYRWRRKSFAHYQNHQVAASFKYPCNSIRHWSFQHTRNWTRPHTENYALFDMCSLVAIRRFTCNIFWWVIYAIYPFICTWPFLCLPLRQEDGRFRWFQLRDTDTILTDWPFLTTYYVFLLAFTICFIYGYNIRTAQPKDDFPLPDSSDYGPEDVLWAMEQFGQRRGSKWLYTYGEKICFAYYLADPGTQSFGINRPWSGFSRRGNFQICFLTFAFASPIIQLPFIIGMSSIFFSLCFAFVITVPAFVGAMLRSIREGWCWRMGVRAREVRRECLRICWSKDGSSPKDRLEWWIRGILEGDKDYTVYECINYRVSEEVAKEISKIQSDIERLKSAD